MNNRHYGFAVLCAAIASPAAFIAGEAFAERAPVLEQIEVPHDYYFREMYLPQVTTGPTSPAWSPDGNALVYSMRGSLWRQQPESSRAVQLTAGPGYDHQPDWSPDGRHIIFVRYEADAMELHLLEVGTGETVRLTGDGAVNLEPRWSPDGTRIAFVSTRGTGRFHLFVGDVDGDSFTAAPLFDERQSEGERYYYSAWDHELSPSWSPDGTELLFVSNPEVTYGTGDIWRYNLATGEGPVLVRREETSWRARPDWAPDGNRLVYASYLGRQWHQLWGASIEGDAEPFPLTYGDFDIFSPRWSPDGQRIAYVTNESGNTSLRVQDVVGGKQVDVIPEERVYLRPTGELALTVRNDQGEHTAARVSVVGADGRAYAPDTAWMHADDGFDRQLSEFETHYFHADGEATLSLPAGPARVVLWHGLEHEIEQRLVTIQAGATSELTVRLEALELPRSWQSASGDVHVHMNYGGTYRNTPERLVRQAEAENLDFVFNLIVNKEQRIPDIAYFSTEPDAASNPNVTLQHAQEFHTSYWGHMGLLGLDDHLLIPDYSAYPGTWAASLYPDNATVADLAQAQDAVVGYVHPFLSPPPDPATDETLTNALPVDVALGNVDYYEVVGFADHHASADVWYRLLNLGFRVAAAGGTDAMANYASLRGPVGINRTYVRTGKAVSSPADRRDAWLAGLKAGKTFATNGPLLGLTVEGRGSGEVIELPEGDHELTYSGFMRSIVPVDHLEVVYSGDVVETISLRGDRRSAEFEGSVHVNGGGWLLLRAWNESSHPMIFDLYPYATTTPVYTSDGEPAQSTADANYFISWIDRIRESAEAHPDYNSKKERQIVLDNLEAARRVFEERRAE